jgi:simple sugar transport system permease protein
LFNVGAHGQFYAGAIAVAFVVYPLEGLPPAIMTPAAVCAGIAGGALWALCPAILRLTYGTDEVITTLMGNFIAALALIEVTTGVLKDPAGTGQSSSTRPIDAVYRWSDATGVSTTLILVATVCVVVVWILLNRTSFGVLAGLAGRNPTMLVWQGATEWRLGCAAFLVSGGMAGLAGAMEVLGPNGQLISDFLPTDGFTAILIALVGGLSVPGSLIASLFFGGLAAATLYLPIMAGLPSSAVDVINAVIAILITARAWPKGFERLLMFMSPAHD